MKKIYFVILGLIVLISGCNRDAVVDSVSTPIAGNTKKGLFALCEGSGAGTSMLSYYNLDTIYRTNIFNPGNLGLYPDGMIFDGTNILITEQGSYLGQGRIRRIDTSGKEISSQVIGENPYSLCISNNKIYVTNGPINKVSVLDFNNLTENKTINVGVNPQEIISYNNKVYVCNAGNYMVPFDSIVSVIDALSDSVIAAITLQKSPSSIALSRGNKLLVGCSGADGKIFMVDPNTNLIIASFSLSVGFDRDISIDKSSDDIYFISYSNDIIKLNLSTGNYQTVISNPNISVNKFYGYVFDSKNRNHYVADAKNFFVNGYIHKYDIYGTYPPTSYQTGIAPRRFLLLNN